MPPGDRGYDPRDMVSRAVSLTGLPGKDGRDRGFRGSVEKVGVRALAAPVSDIRNQLIS